MRRVCLWVIGICSIGIVFMFMDLKDGAFKRIEEAEATSVDRTFARIHEKCRPLEGGDNIKYARCFDRELQKGIY